MRLLVTVAAVLGVLAPSAAAAARVDQMVVFRSGKARVSHPSMAQTTAKVGTKRCTVGAATPLAALIRSDVGPLSLRDFGSCSKRAADAGSLFVSAIGPDRNKSSDGWVYKAGNVLGTAGSADPNGPLGRGRLRPGTRVTWFWCHVTGRDGGCPHTLVIAATASAGALTVHVREYNDGGKGKPASGATVHAGSQTATTGADGSVRITPPAGRYSVFATQATRIRSFPVTVEVA
ncbi:MAG: hypothetical protein QOJ29_3735 [Thermoleophilaceae bacterium]|jgi:hypothetical protein|nr:hypothetical protein [Thermoleophilaceae bacterium]